MRPFPLGDFRTGISRLRDKGGASPNSLYDGLNCYITADGTASMRPASVHEHALPPGATKGLMLYKGKFMVFASEPVESGDPDYVIEILKHPDAESTATLVDIHYAQPFLGYPYVTAEWSDGLIEDYWLQTAETWQADHVYRVGALVQPTDPNGYFYRATRLGAVPPTWTPNVERTVGDRVIPTDDVGFDHVVIETQGASPRSGAVEPAWAETEGGITYEDADNAGGGSSGSSGGSGSTTVPPDVEDRYGSGKKSATGTSTRAV